MNCEELKSQVIRWLGQELECRADGSTLTAVLPLLKPDGDSLEIGIEPVGTDLWRLSDLGDVHAHFYLANVDIFEDSSRGDEFRQIVKAANISESDKELQLTVASARLPASLFEFAHALQSIFSLQFATKLQSLARDFPSIVARFLAEQRTSFEIPSDNIPGLTGSWKFNFILNHVKTETLVKAISIPKPADAMRTAKQTIFEINDVRQIRPSDSSFVVIADDEGPRSQFWKESVMRVFAGYHVPVIPFEGERDRLISLARSYSNQ